MFLPISEIKKIKFELKYRFSTLRKENNLELNLAISLGDLPENFPYDSAVERQRMNELRINNLDSI